MCQKQLFFAITPCSPAYIVQKIYSTDAQSCEMPVVDVNNDNKLDIIIANFQSHNVGVLLNTGNDIFTAQTAYSTDGLNPYSVVVIDITSDEF